RIEKIVLGGRTYYRPDWQGVRRRAPRVVRDVGDTVRASLSVLGRVLEDHVVLAADGRVLETPPAAPDSPNVTPLAPEVIAGVIATVVATSAPALAPWIAVAARDVAFERGPVEADLVEARDTGALRFTRGAPSAGGFGGPFRGPPSSPRVTEARSDSLGARRALGGFGGPFRGPLLRRA